jgi:hypothetical protein
VQPLVDQAGSYATQALNSANAALTYSSLASGSSTAAGQSATNAQASAMTAQGAATSAQGSANAASASAASAVNSANHADGSEAVAQAYADVGMAWAEHMPDTIPPNILAVQGITGDHWSSRWWANRAAMAASTVGGALVGDTPATAQRGPLWWDSVSGQLFIQYDDGNSIQWVIANSLDASVLEGSFLPLTGGTVSGRVNFFDTDWFYPFASWVSASSHVYALHPTGSIGITGAAQTVDGEKIGTPVASIGVAGFAMNNRTGPGNSAAWGGYFEARQYPGAFSYTTGIEIDVANVSGTDSYQSTPYGITSPFSIGLNLASGGGVSAYGMTAQAASVALVIMDNEARFQTGIMFRSTALVGTNGLGDSSVGHAISLATNHAITWTKPDNTPGPMIISNQTTGTAPQLHFENGTLRLSAGNLNLDGGGLGLNSGNTVNWYFAGATALPGVACAQTTGSAIQLVFDNGQAYLRDGVLALPLAGVTAGVPASGATSLQLRVNNNAGSSMVPVIMGPPDSAGSGYRTLRVLN